MFDGHRIGWCGLFCDLSATLFLLADEVRGRDESIKLLDIQEHLNRLEEITSEVGEESTEPGQGTVRGHDIGQMFGIMQEAAREALENENRMVRTKMNDISTASRRRRSVIVKAIALVALGGVLELVGVSFFHG